MFADTLQAHIPQALGAGAGHLVHMPGHAYQRVGRYGCCLVVALPLETVLARGMIGGERVLLIVAGGYRCSCRLWLLPASKLVAISL
jgi:hypothetical protein